MSNAVKARMYDGVLVMYHTQRGEWESSKANDGDAYTWMGYRGQVMDCAPRMTDL